MIKPTELRIGNLILWNPKLFNPTTTLPPSQVEVTSIQEDKLGFIAPGVEKRVEPFEDDLLPLETPHGQLNEFEPLLLTVDLVKQCGFLYSDGNHDYSDYKKSPLSIRFKNDNTVLVTLSDHEFTYQSLHQLQNLYFALTGDELRIELL